MPLRPFLSGAAIAAATIAAASTLPAQVVDRPKAQTSVGTDLSSKAARRFTVTSWTIIPESMIRIHLPRGWSVKRQPDGMIGPNGIYAEFLGVAHPGAKCQDVQPSVTIDLRTIRANGFRLAEVVVRHVKAPRDFWREPGPRRDAPRDLSKLTEYGAQGVMFSKGTTRDMRLPRACWTAVSLELKIRGPEGVDPLTGKAYPPSRPVR